MAGFSVSPWQRAGWTAKGLCAVACVVFSFGCQSRLPGANDRTLSEELAVSPEEVDFGELRPGEVARRIIEIRNRGSRTLHLLEPDRDCGCTRAKLGAVQLGPGQGTTMEVEFVAPLSPQRVAKHVWLACREFPEARWPIAVGGQVVAALWAEPGVVRLEIPRGGTATASVVLRHVPSVRIARVESEAAEMSVEMNGASEVAREVTLRIADTGLRQQQIVDGHLAVFVDSETAPGLRVPVRWQVRSKVRFAPGTLMVLPRGRRLQRTVTVLLDSDVPAESLEIAPLLPGVELVSRRIHGKRVILYLALDADRFSPGRHAAVRARSHDGQEQDELIIECGPGA